MSRIGKKKILLPEGVGVAISDKNIEITGPKGKDSFSLPEGISAKEDGGVVSVTRSADSKILRSLHGTSTRVIGNIVTGVSTGFVKKLEYKGVGFTVVVEGNKLSLRLGFSHQIIIDIPDGLTVTVVKNVISVEGTSKEIVGEFAAKVRELKKPEVYKGKGIRYQGEFVKKKAGKAAQTSAGA